jgi:catechol 2,3-dioxygenase-like lactoylglutathione lyase family enzyme
VHKGAAGSYDEGMSSSPVGFHHVAFACKDLAETVSFYEDLGFPLIHTEVEGVPEHFLRHVFFDTGDGSCIAFFELHNVGEQPEWSTDLAESTKTPVWVNHVAFRASEQRQTEVRARMDAKGIAPLMELSHGWCHSLYYVDPNKIMIEFCRDTPGIVADPTGAHAQLSSVPAAPVT